MSDGQTETNEMIAAQNAPLCVRLERGEAVKFQDADGGWQVGAVLKWRGAVGAWSSNVLVHTASGIYAVSPIALSPYPPRCERCGGEGVTWTFEDWNPGGHRVTTPCPECGGEGTIISDVSKYLGGESIPCAYECPACGGSGRKRA